MIINGIDYAARTAQMQELGVEPYGSDTEFGVEWVHCNQHGRVHGTGWCTVSNIEKQPMKSADYESAKAEARNLGLWFHDAEVSHE